VEELKSGSLALSYSDIYLVPEYSEVKTRANTDVSVEFLGGKWASCLIPANMLSVIDEKIARWCSKNNIFYIYHRFGDQKKFIGNMNWANSPANNVSISIGVKQADKDLLEWILDVNYRIDYLTIDIAHGDSILTKQMIAFIKKIGLKCKIIAGNVCTSDAVKRLADWGADAAKCGIGGGGICSTKNQTGFHVPMFTCIQNCAEMSPIPIIADGGIKENGHIAKALVAGADMVMVGGLLAACTDAPGENIYANKYYKQTEFGPKEFSGELTHKKYHGSSGRTNKLKTGQELKHFEGFDVELPCNGMTFVEKIEEIKQSISSAISYAGGRGLADLKSVKWVRTK